MKPKHYIPLIIIALSTINSADAAISNQIPKAFAKAAAQASSREAAMRVGGRLAIEGGRQANKKNTNKDSSDSGFILGWGIFACFIYIMYRIEKSQ